MDDLGGPVELEFLINNPELIAAAAQAEATMQGVTDKVQSSAQQASAAIENLASQTREGLKLQVQQYQALADLTPSSNITRLTQYNQLIEQTQAEIVRLGNVGKTGFDDMGNAIQKVIPAVQQLKPAIEEVSPAVEEVSEKAGKFEQAIARATDVSSIGARVVSMFSRQIISLGVGFLSFAIGAKAIEQLVKWISNLDMFTGRLDQAKQNMIALNDVMKDADKAAGSQIGTLEILYKTATDLTRSTQDRVQAAKDLKATYPEAFANSSTMAILNGQESKSYQQLVVDIYASAKATAAKAKIEQLASQQLDEQWQIDLNNREKAAKLRQAADNYQKDKTSNTSLLATAMQRQSADPTLQIITPGSQINTAKDLYDATVKAINGAANEANLKPTQNIQILQGQADSLMKLAGGASKAGEDLKKANEILGSSLENFNKLISGISDKADLDNIKTALQDKINNLAPTDPQIKNLQDKIRQVQEIEKAYQPKVNDGKAALSEANTLLASQTSLQEKIQALKTKSQSKDKTRDEQEIDDVKATYQAIYNEVVAQNKKYTDFIKKNKGNAADAAKVGLVYIDPNTVNQDEATEEAGVRGKQGLEQAKNQIEQEKTLFADYEAFKLKAGTEAANQLYGSQLKGFTNFIDYLKSLAPTEAELNSPDAAVKARANALKDYLKTVLPAADTVLQSQTIKQLEQYIADTQSFEDRSKQIIAKTNDEITALTTAQNNATDQATKDDYAHRIELAKKQGEAQVDQLINQQQATIDSYKGLAGSIETMTTEQANLRIKEAQATAAADYASGKISAAAYKEIIGLIEQAGAAIKANSIAGAFGELATVMEQLSQASAGLDKNLTATLNTLGSLFKQVQTLTTDIPKLAAALKNYQQTKSDAGGGFLGTVSAVASVIPVAGAIISAGVAVVSGVINFFKAAHASAVAAAAQILAYQNSLITGQIQYNELLRDQERTQTDISKLSLQQLQTQEQTLALQTQQAQADYNTLLQQIQATGQQVTGEHTTKYGGFLGIGQKTKVVQDLAGLSDADYDTLEKLYTEGKLTDTTKAWFEQLQTVKGELDDIGTSAQAAVDQINQIATGTTANDIATSIVQGFEAGKRTAADFANDFQSLMQNAAVSVFESNYLSGKIATFYQQFSDASSAPGGLTADAIAKLKAEYATVITDAGTQFGNLEKVVGVISGSQANSPTLTGEITSSLTEDTATQLEGAINGLRLTNMLTNSILTTNGETMQDQLTEMRTQTLLQMQISANTLRSANNSDTMVGSLKNIDNNTSSASLTNLLRAAGH